MATQKVVTISSGRKQEASIRVGFPVYNSSGEVTSPKVWNGSVTTNGSGTATVDYSSAGFSTVVSVQLTALANGAGVTTAPLASIVGTPSTTSCNILTLESKNTGVLIGGTVEGLEASASRTVYVTVWGT